MSGCEMIPVKLDKHSGHDMNRGWVFAKADEFRIKGVDSKVASCVTARYYKGLAADGDNLVIVKKIE